MTGAGEGQTPGFECPKCGSRIPVAVDQLLSLGSVTCPGCALVLQVDTDRSADALHSLRDYQEGTAAARAIRDQENETNASNEESARRSEAR